MNTKGGMAVLFFATIAALMTSCSHDNVYDSDYINEQYKASFATNVLGGGTIDPTQTWNASAQSKLTVKVDLDAGATYRVCAFTENPLYTSDATLLDQETATSGSTVTLNFAKPIALTKVYVAAINAKNRYDVYAVDMEGTEASATIGGTETTRATVNGVSTAASSYQHEYSYFKVPEFDASKYTDVTTIDASDYSKLDLKPSESEGV
jgi:predicted thioesterase